MPALAQQRQRLISGAQSHIDYLGTLGYEHGIGRVQTVAKLGFGQTSVHGHTFIGKVCYLIYHLPAR